MTPKQRAEIDALRAQAAGTRRTVVPALEAILYQPFPVLDRGFVRVVDYLGDDSAIVQAARVSYGRGTRQTRSDRGLIRTLMRERHTSPFEMCEIKLHLKLPIVVMRQWVRHRTASVNEYSARYSEMSDEVYRPFLERIQGQSASNKQGSEGALPDGVRQDFLDHLAGDNAASVESYRRALDHGVARETARLGMPLNSYTECYWKIDLHNLLHLLGLRAHPDAQWEIRQYAGVILDEVVRRWVPLVHEAFTDYRLEAFTLSRQQRALLRTLLGPALAGADYAAFGLTPREFAQLTAALS